MFKRYKIICLDFLQLKNYKNNKSSIANNRIADAKFLNFRNDVIPWAIC